MVLGSNQDFVAKNRKTRAVLMVHAERMKELIEKEGLDKAKASSTSYREIVQGKHQKRIDTVNRELKKK